MISTLSVSWLVKMGGELGRERGGKERERERREESKKKGEMGDEGWAGSKQVDEDADTPLSPSLSPTT
jgi:hypothetical protein